VDPSETPPWRVIEAPTTTPVEAAPPARAPGGPTAIPRLALAAGSGAVACGVIAFAVAFGGAGGAAVDVDGGVALSSDPVASDLVGGGLAAVRPSGGLLVVEVVGAVRNPGVYRVPGGSRVGDLIAKAGGYGPRIDTVRAEHELNLAATVQDGDRVRVPSRDDPAGASPPPASSGGAAGRGTASGPVDLNHATAEELDALPGVGPVTVQKILDARAEAPFATIDELQSRGIVGAKTLDKLRPLVIVG
jgi:competence protein ComEA